MRQTGDLTDEELLASGSPEAMGCFYDRTVGQVLGFFARRTRGGGAGSLASGVGAGAGAGAGAMGEPARGGWTWLRPLRLAT